MLVNFSQSHPKLGEPGLSVEAGSRFSVAVGIEYWGQCNFWQHRNEDKWRKLVAEMSNFSSALINQFLLLGYWYWTKLWNLRCHEATLDMRDREVDMLAILPALVSTLARGAALWLAAGPLLGSVPCTCHLSSSHTPQLWIHLYSVHIYSSSNI